MKISVVIPTYNRAHYIRLTLESILRQTYTPHEIIIVDDGSTDNTKEVIDLLKVGDLIKYYKIQNSGATIARKIAIDRATGDWIAMCDSDDIWEEEHLESFINSLDIFPSTEMYFSDFITSDNPNLTKLEQCPTNWWDNIINKKVVKDSEILSLNDNVYQSLLEFNPIFVSSTVFKLSLYNKIGGIKTELGRMNSEDAHLTRRLVAFGKVTCNLKRTVTIVKHEENFSTNFVKNYIGRLHILKRLVDYNEIPLNLHDITRTEIEKTIPDVFDSLVWDKQYESALLFYQDNKSCVKNFGLKRSFKYLIIKFLY